MTLLKHVHKGTSTICASFHLKIFSKRIRKCSQRLKTNSCMFWYEVSKQGASCDIYSLFWGILLWTVSWYWIQGIFLITLQFWMKHQCSEYLAHKPVEALLKFLNFICFYSPILGLFFSISFIFSLYLAFFILWTWSLQINIFVLM